MVKATWKNRTLGDVTELPAYPSGGGVAPWPCLTVGITTEVSIQATDEKYVRIGTVGKEHTH